MALCRPGDKPLYEPKVVNLLTHICVTRAQRINTLRPTQNDLSYADKFKSIFLHETCCILIPVRRTFCSRDWINNKPELLQITAWRKHVPGAWCHHVPVETIKTLWSMMNYCNIFVTSAMGWRIDLAWPLSEFLSLSSPSLSSSSSPLSLLLSLSTTTSSPPTTTSLLLLPLLSPLSLLSYPTILLSSLLYYYYYHYQHPINTITIIITIITALDQCNLNYLAFKKINIVQDVIGHDRPDVFRFHCL